HQKTCHVRSSSERKRWIYLLPRSRRASGDVTSSPPLPRIRMDDTAFLRRQRPRGGGRYVGDELGSDHHRYANCCGWQVQLSPPRPSTGEGDAFSSALVTIAWRAIPLPNEQEDKIRTSKQISMVDRTVTGQSAQRLSAQ